MAEIDQDILLGRLAVHYKILSKDQAQQAIRLWRSTSAGQELGEFLVTESYIPAEALPKLLKARDEYLRRSEAKSGAGPQPSAPQPDPPVGAATVRITPEMMAAAAQHGPTAEAVPAPAQTVAFVSEDVSPSPQSESFELPEPEPVAARPFAEADSELPSPELPSPELPSPELPSLPSPDSISFGPPTPEPAAPEPGAPEPAAPEPVAPEPVAPAFFADAAAAPDLDSLPVEELSGPAPAVEAPLEAAQVELPEPSVEAAEPIAVVDEPRGLLSVEPGVTLEDLLRQACRLGASDLHVHSGAPLKLRLHGVLQDASPAIDRDSARELIYGILTTEQHGVLEEHQQLDFAFEVKDAGRFRANSYLQHRGLDAVFRIIPPSAPTLEELGLPEALGRFSEYHQGIVLLTGPAGCGKSSTMAALVRMINESRSEHILTIEDPIEYVHAPRSCVVNQREVGPHTESFGRALRAALREDPDIIVIGELRDLETISLALTAAETGHLVLGTLHTASTIPTLNRMFGVFPPDQQAQIRTMVSESLRAIVSQRLVPRADGEGRVPALEILINNRAIGNLVRENRTFQIKSILQTGGQAGMCELDASLAELVKKRIITKEVARREAIEPKRFA